MKTYQTLRILRRLADAKLTGSVLYVTQTALQKSIIDATQIFRDFTLTNGVHDYSLQSQGPEWKIVKPLTLISPPAIAKTQISFYRPGTKEGDPRVWVYELKKVMSNEGYLVIFILDGELYAFFDSDETVWNLLEDRTSWLSRELKLDGARDPTDSLLSKLSKFGSGQWFDSVRAGDTGVGATLEALLGISANSSKLPDFMGIEIKASRSDSRKQPTRVNLFAQVPDWSQSHCKSSAEILDTYGYPRDETFKLYCTVSARKPNSQGLYLHYDENQKSLKELFTPNSVVNPSCDQDVALWGHKQLLSRLREKHPTTCWVTARSRFVDGVEQFQFTEAVVSTGADESMFFPLVIEGVITVDHLIKRNERNSVVEKGPLFKISPKDRDFLFPSSKRFPL